jgi:hypothetical protein
LWLVQSGLCCQMVGSAGIEPAPTTEVLAIEAVVAGSIRPVLSNGGLGRN